MSELSPNLLDLDRFSLDVRRVERRWGYELIYGATERYCGKILFVRKGQEVSPRFNRVKDEVIYLQEGRVELEIGEPGRAPDLEVVGPGRAFRLAPGTVHGLRALEDSLVLEVSTPELDDVVSLENRHER